VNLLKKTPKNLIAKVVYLTQGKLYPDFAGIEIGIAEKLTIKAVARACGKKQADIENDLRKTGDIGETAQNFLVKKTQSTLGFQKSLTVQRVYESFEKMAKKSGTGTVDTKMGMLAGLLVDASPKEAKYILRTLTGKLRLGIADMTVLDALAIAYGGGKETRRPIERAYNISSDLGRVADVIVNQGLEGIENYKVMVFEPIRPMLAERLPEPETILDKLGGKCVAEYKYDGERVQLHKKGNEVRLFSRKLEKISNQYPDAIELVCKYVKANEAILEGECVAMDLESGEMLPFQELMHRRRKYGITEAIAQYPVSLFMFDALYIDGKDLTQEPYPARRKALENVIPNNSKVQLAKQITTNKIKGLEEFFEQAIEDGCEGIVCKSINPESIYQAGARDWLWIKFKRDYKSEMTDTVDLTVVGAFYGRGKRAGSYGALLLAAYNKETDVFETITKLGTGFTDKDLIQIPEILNAHKIPRKHSRVLSTLEADVWFEPAIVLEVLGAEITLSPIHTCAMNSIRKDSGLAIRFPRFTGKYRTDKAPEDSTINKEIIKMYQNQLKKINQT
ncbi:MAG: ATP-dependent DNA ligase, partial [Crenarchaeota archaeon]|nr:ATP-dependent DNA ligase [Thermoproteota archaeon]